MPYSKLYYYQINNIYFILFLHLIDMWIVSYQFICLCLTYMIVENKCFWHERKREETCFDHLRITTVSIVVTFFTFNVIECTKSEETRRIVKKKAKNYLSRQATNFIVPLVCGWKYGYLFSLHRTLTKKCLMFTPQFILHRNRSVITHWTNWSRI